MEVAKHDLHFLIEKISQENLNSDLNVMLNDEPVTAPEAYGYRRGSASYSTYN